MPTESCRIIVECTKFWVCGIVMLKKSKGNQTNQVRTSKVGFCSKKLELRVSRNHVPHPLSPHKTNRRQILMYSFLFMNKCYASTFLESKLGSRDVNYEHSDSSYFQTSLFYLCVEQYTASVYFYISQTIPSKEPVDQARRIARGVLQSSDQTNRKLNWVLKFDVILNG